MVAMPNLESLSKALGRLKQPDIIFESALCSRTRWKKSTCKLCQEGCATGALHFNPQLELDEEKCTSCGLCISRCPNGAFWSRREYSVLQREIVSLLSLNKSKTLTFCCAQRGKSDKNIISLPCLGCLTESFLLVPFAAGATQVEILWPECKGCVQEKHISHIEMVLLLGRKLAAMVGKSESCIKVISDVRYSGSFPDSRPRISRRDFFLGLRGEATQAIAVLLPDFSSDKPESPWKHVMGNKRAHLLRLLRAFPHRVSTCLEREGLPLSEIEIHPGCAGCNVCSTLCPTGALERIDVPDGVDVYFLPDICTGCRVCQDACIFQTISIASTFDLLNLAVRQRRRIIHLDMKVCWQCNSEFMGVNEEICPLCRMKQDRNASISAARG